MGNIGEQALYIVTFNASATPIPDAVGNRRRSLGTATVEHSGSQKKKGLSMMAERVLHWLMCIQSRFSSPVKCILVGTHSDKCEPGLSEEVVKLLGDTLQQHKESLHPAPFPEIVDIYIVHNMKGDPSLKPLRHKMIDTVSEMVGDGHRVPLSYLALEQKLQEFTLEADSDKKAVPVLQRKDFDIFAAECGLKSVEQVGTAATMLCQWGALGQWSGMNQRSPTDVYLCCADEEDERLETFCQILRDTGFKVGRRSAQQLAAPPSGMLPDHIAQLIRQTPVFIFWASASAISSPRCQAEILLAAACVESANSFATKYLAAVALDETEAESAHLPANVGMSLGMFDTHTFGDEPFSPQLFNDIITLSSAQVSTNNKISVPYSPNIKTMEDYAASNKCSALDFLVTDLSWLSAALAQLLGDHTRGMMKAGLLDHTVLPLVLRDYPDAIRAQLLLLARELLFCSRGTTDAVDNFPLGLSAPGTNTVKLDTDVTSFWTTYVKTCCADDAAEDHVGPPQFLPLRPFFSKCLASKIWI